MTNQIPTLQFYINGSWQDSKTESFQEIFNPSTGEVIAKSPCCTKSEVEAAIASAAKAYPGWTQTPIANRMNILLKFRQLIDEHLDDLTLTLCTEHGKVWEEARGDVLKAREGVDFSLSTPTLMMGESLMNVTRGYDTVLYRESLGVFAGIIPFNFPAMIPFGWMTPLCIAAGNTIVLKSSSATPLTSIKMIQLLEEAGLPKGVVNLVTCRRQEADLFLTDPRVKGISFVGSTSVGKHIYQTAAAHGKRVQALCEAKNHALVLEDAILERTARGIINAAFGCAGERCMALPVVVVQDTVADPLIQLLVRYAQELKIGPAYDKTSQMGPLISESHRNFVSDYIDRGVKEGAKLLLDGRNLQVEGHSGGFYLGPTIFDQVTEGMTIGSEEIFGPVLCIKRVPDFRTGLEIMNQSPFANGSVIYTQSGFYAREFASATHGGMVGINVGIPVPMGVFPFTGHKDSFFGDLHCLGKDGLRFYTETKAVTSTWFQDEDRNAQVSTWDGML